MQTISLTQGQEAIVDDSDYEWLNKIKWFAVWDGHNWYAARKLHNRQIRMHNVLMNPPQGFEVDHRDGNGLNNQRGNLRVCIHRHNMMNRPENVTNNSGFKGVCWRKKEQKWCAQIRIHPKVKWLGIFEDKIEAAKAYDAAAEKHFGEFAVTNQSLGKLPAV